MDNYAYAATAVAVIRCYPSHTTAVTDLQDVLYCTDVLAHTVMTEVIYACVFIVVLYNSTSCTLCILVNIVNLMYSCTRIL